MPEGRWGHSACAHGTKMVIFGGISHKGYKSADIYELETNQYYVASMLKETGDHSYDEQVNSKVRSLQLNLH